MAWVFKLFGSSLFKYGATLVAGGALVIGVLNAYWHYTELVTKAADYDNAVLLIDELRDANAGLVSKLDEQEERHNAEIVRLNADRVALDNERKAVQKRAFIEAGRLKQALAESQDANNWYNTILPDSIKRLRDESFSGSE